MHININMLVPMLFVFALIHPPSLHPPRHTCQRASLQRKFRLALRPVLGLIRALLLPSLCHAN